MPNSELRFKLNPAPKESRIIFLFGKEVGRVDNGIATITLPDFVTEAVFMGIIEHNNRSVRRLREFIDNAPPGCHIDESGLPERSMYEQIS